VNVVNALYPTLETLLPLAERTDGPIAMVNLLKFRDRAEYPDGRADGGTGRDAYLRYVEAMQPIVERGGGRFLFAGTARALVIGEVDDLWDEVAIAEYPSPAAFKEIAMAPEVMDIAIHREAGLAGQLLIMTDGHVLAGLR